MMRYGLSPDAVVVGAGRWGRTLTATRKDWRDYYTKELADMVYEKYRKDFETFGYERI